MTCRGNAQQRVTSVLDKSSECRQRVEYRFKKWALPKSLVDDLAKHLDDRAKHLTVATCERDSVILSRGSQAGFVFRLLNGFAKLYLPHTNGNRAVVGRARFDDLLGFVDGFDSENHRRLVFEARASTKCSVGLASRDYLIKLLRSLDVGFVTRLLEYINTTWSRMLEWYATSRLSFRKRLTTCV